RCATPSAGEQGAGFPNPDGGFVDSGPISFDTTWYDWGPYAEEMVRRIRLHWDIPELARLGWKGKLTVRFFIRGDGRVEGARILSVSGVPPFDNAALQAVLTSSPFRPLPKDLGSDREGVTVTFFYNIRPESEGQKGGGHVSIVDRSRPRTRPRRHSRRAAAVALPAARGVRAHSVAPCLMKAGSRVIPGSPGHRTLLGETCYPSILEIPPGVRLDIVDVFRRSSEVGKVADQAIVRGAGFFFMQLGVV